MSQRGSAAVEISILLPVLVTMLLGTIDFGRLFYAYITVSSAAHEGAVYAARFYATVIDVTPSALAAVVTGEARGYLVAGPGGNTTIAGPTMVSDATKVPMAQVQVTYHFPPFTPFPLKGPIPVTAIAAAPLPGQVLP